MHAHGALHAAVFDLQPARRCVVQAPLEALEGLRHLLLGGELRLQKCGPGQQGLGAVMRGGRARRGDSGSEGGVCLLPLGLLRLHVLRGPACLRVTK